MPPKAFFEQDIGPGELFGEAALGGIHTRMHLAQAITHVDVIVIDDQDFMSAQVCAVYCLFVPNRFFGAVVASPKHQYCAQIISSLILFFLFNSFF